MKAKVLNIMATIDAHHRVASLLFDTLYNQRVFGRGCKT